MSEYQKKENIVLICFKTKKNKKDYQTHFQCKSKPDCPFRAKLSETEKITILYTSESHNHDRCAEDLGIIFFIS